MAADLLHCWPYGPRRDPELEALLERAKGHVMTPKEVYEQRISWIQGMSGKLADPMPTRESVVKMLAENGIVDPEPNDVADSGRKE